MALVMGTEDPAYRLVGPSVPQKEQEDSSSCTVIDLVSDDEPQLDSADGPLTVPTKAEHDSGGEPAVVDETDGDDANVREALRIQELEVELIGQLQAAKVSHQTAVTKRKHLEQEGEQDEQELQQRRAQRRRILEECVAVDLKAEAEMEILRYHLQRLAAQKTSWKRSMCILL